MMNQSMNAPNAIALMSEYVGRGMAANCSSTLLAYFAFSATSVLRESARCKRFRRDLHPSSLEQRTESRRAHVHMEKRSGNRESDEFELPS